MEENIDKLKNEALLHKDNALNKLDHLLSQYIDEKQTKKVHLLSYWIEDFTKYISEEESFDSRKLKKYKRGSIIKANLGFNIGNEEGGLHYCIVIDKNNYLSSGTLTVIPLTSKKENKTYSDKTVDIGTEIYDNLNNIYLKKKDSLSQKYENIWKLSSEKMNQFTYDFEYMRKIEDEIIRMKKGSIALVQHVTTISKQRIYNPKNSKDILSNLRVSMSTLDLIDLKFKDLFLNIKKDV